MTYSQFGCCGNHQISANYVVDNLVMCENRVNTHSHRAYFTNYFLNVKTLASREKKKCLIYSSEAQQCFDSIKELANLLSTILLHFSSDLYLRNGAPPLRVAALEASHHPITALPVGTHRAMLETPYFHFNY